LKQPVFIRIYSNQQLQEIKQFPDAQIIIGSGDDAQLQLEGEGLSSLHAMIEERTDGYYLTDLGSESGTFVEEQKIVEHKLETGSSFSLGSYTIEFFIGVPKPSKLQSKPPLLKHLDKAKPATPSLPTNKEIKVASPIKEKSSEKKTTGVETPVLPKTTTGSAPKKNTIENKDSGTTKKVNTKVPPAVQEKNTPIKGSKNEKFDPNKFSKRTFAPASEIKDLSNVISPATGSRVQVVVAWKERVLSTYYYNHGQSVSIGSSPANDIVVPLVGFSKTSFKLFSFEQSLKVYLSPEMKGEYTQHGHNLSLSELMMSNAFPKKGELFEVELAQNEMLKIGFASDEMHIYIKYAEESTKPIVGPFLDLSFSEFTSIIFAILTVAIFGLYMLIYSPDIEEELKQDQPIRRAVVTFRPPKVKPPTPPKKEAVVGRVAVRKPKPKKTKLRATSVKNIKKKSGKSAKVASSKPKKRRRRRGSARKGGAVKTGKSGSTAKTKTRNLKKFGMFGAFGGKGANTKLDKVFDGAGGISGLSGTNTGFSGQKSQRKGSNLGSRLKATGVSGKTSSTVAIGDVGTKGKGTGISGTGTGGFGSHQKVNVKLAGNEAEFIGTIDREAIRRVLNAEKRAFAHCYNVELKKNSNVYGKLKLQWTIIEGGEVEKVKVVSNTTGSKKIARCMMNKLENLRFPEPPPDQQATVVYPWVFSTQ
jgi:pSer/pThr/pTyr-binding forkhead associated (FHA) protein